MISDTQSAPDVRASLSLACGGMMWLTSVLAFDTPTTNVSPVRAVVASAEVIAVHLCL